MHSSHKPFQGRRERLGWLPVGGLGRWEALSIAIVIPCFRVRAHILPLLQKIGPEVRWIFVVVDDYPERPANTSPPPPSAAIRW
jgi:hypothetical protein